MKQGVLKLLIGMLLLMFPLFVHSQDYFVKADGTGDGSSWGNASGDLQGVLDSAFSGDEIWIAEGSYFPTSCTNCTDTDRAATFLITKAVRLLGGFPNTGSPVEDDQNPELYPTILSGAIGLANDNSDNSLHICTVDYVGTSYIRFVGIHLQDGHSNLGVDSDLSGPAVKVNDGRMRFYNCKFLNNTALGNGGTVYRDAGSGIFDFCTFENNNAAKGAGIYYEDNGNNDFRLNNCVFKNNTAASGGAIYVDSNHHSRIFGCLFQGNHAGRGGAIYLEEPIEEEDADSKIMNCTFVNNTASVAGSCVHVSILNARLYLINNILWANEFPNLSVDSGTNSFRLSRMLADSTNADSLGSNLFGSPYFSHTEDPFMDYANDDFTLREESVAVNNGTVFELVCANDDYQPLAYYETFDLESDEDLLEHPREITRPDIGAYEFYPSNSYIPILYVNKNANGLNNGFTWADAYNTLEDAFKKARKYTVDEIWVAEGTYQPIDQAFSNSQNTRGFHYQIFFRKEGNITLYGGFPNIGNPTFAERDWNNHPTIVSGELGDVDYLEDNMSSLFARSRYSDSEITIDGLMIKGAAYAGINSRYVTVKNCQFTNNRRGIYIDNYYKGDCGGNVLAQNTVFSNNEQGIDGDDDSSLTVDSCTFFNNTRGIHLSKDSDLEARNCTFSSNNALGGGGAINASGDTEISIHTCSFVNNTATAGGAISASRPNKFIVVNSLFAQNSGGQGGAISVGSKIGESDQFTNCTFYNNVATTIGGGSVLSVWSSGFSTDSVVFRNCILWDQEMPFAQGSMPATYPIVFKNNLSNFENCESVAPTLSCVGYNIFDTLSPFIDESAHVFHLNDSSLAINNGENAFIDLSLFPFDLGGNSRIDSTSTDSTTVDIGAYEYEENIMMFLDEDNDGFLSSIDCDDNDPNVNPNATEIPYNGIDDDCNTATFDDDLDQDGSPLAIDCDDNNPLVSNYTIEIPYNDIDDDCNPETPDDDLDGDGFVLAEDCDDMNPLANPMVVETPYNGIDDDCNVATLDDDLDQDGFALAEDCDDNNPLVNNGATEIPYNGIDDDCNAATLDDDLDQDGFPFSEDCDDNNPLINPDATEIPYNGIDDDCNAATLDDDLDQDGFALAEDCDDNNPLINNGATEIPYNGIDDDCNEVTLDDDLDQDGFALAEDCDDNNPLINNGATEIPYNGIDDDCNTATLDDDLDQDGFALAEDCDDNNPLINTDAVEIPYNGIDDDCNAATLDDDLDQDGFVLAEDCNDNNPLINNGATEIPYNGIDEDCNATTLDDDLDQDGFVLAEDCDDTNAAINTAATEIPNNEIDEDCDGEDLITIGTNTISTTKPRIFPNPTLGALQVLFPEIIQGTYELRTLTGKLIIQNDLQKETSVDLENQPGGIYLLLIKTDDGVWVERIVKMIR